MISKCKSCRFFASYAELDDDADSPATCGVCSSKDIDVDFDHPVTSCAEYLERILG